MWSNLVNHCPVPCCCLHRRSLSVLEPGCPTQVILCIVFLEHWDLPHYKTVPRHSPQFPATFLNTKCLTLCIVFAFSHDEFGKHPYLIFRKMWYYKNPHWFIKCFIFYGLQVKLGYNRTWIESVMQDIVHYLIWYCLFTFFSARQLYSIYAWLFILIKFTVYNIWILFVLIIYFPD